MEDLKELIWIGSKQRTYRLVGTLTEVTAAKQAIDRGEPPEDYMTLVSRGKPCFCGSGKRYKHCCAARYGVAERKSKPRWKTRRERQKYERDVEKARRRPHVCGIKRLSKNSIQSAATEDS